MFSWLSEQVFGKSEAPQASTTEAIDSEPVLISNSGDEIVEKKPEVLSDESEMKYSEEDMIDAPMVSQQNEEDEEDETLAELDKLAVQHADSTAAVFDILSKREEHNASPVAKHAETSQNSSELRHIELDRPVPHFVKSRSLASLPRFHSMSDLNKGVEPEQPSSSNQPRPSM